MPYYDVVNLENIKDEYDKQNTLWLWYPKDVGIWHEVSR